MIFPNQDMNPPFRTDEGALDYNDSIVLLEVIPVRLRALLFLGALLGIPGGSAYGQDAPPGTDIFLAPIALSEDGMEVGDPVNITARPGYDNQPFFSPDGASLLFTSIRHGQADIYRYLFDREKALRVTRTPESEYSPTAMPVTTEFSVVQVEKDQAQRLWAFSDDGEGARLLLEPVKQVGYHVWIDRNRVGLFVLGDPHRLEVADLRTGTTVPVTANIGRCLALVPGSGVVSFMQPAADGEWWIKTFDPDTRRIENLVPAVAESQDYAWTPDGSLLMARDSHLFRWRPGEEGWTEIARFTDPALAGITRLAVSPDGARLALVSDEGS